MLHDYFFAALGFYIDRGFLGADDCARLRAEARDAPSQDANIVQGPEVTVDLDYRRTRRAEMQPDTEAWLKARFEAAMPRIAAALKVDVTRMQAPQLLVYRPGDFFSVHPDNSERPDIPEFLRERAVTVLLFLGHDDVPEGTAGGGDFLFHELLPDPRMAKRAYPVSAAPGKLVAFPARTLHEVKPVLHGVRYSAVTWFC